jgi:ribokinase
MITVIGSINLDLIARVERLPAPGETVSGEEFTSSPGGKGANQALAARRSGARVRMVGAVGRDGFTGQALALLREDGVDLSLVRETHASTGTALILVAKDGENVIAVIAGANAHVSPADVRGAVMDAGDTLLLQQEIPLRSVAAALAAARAGGVRTILNTAPFRKEAAPLLGEADIVVANETEFDLHAQELQLQGADRPARMQDFARRSGRTIVVTLGSEGLAAATPAGVFTVPAMPVTPVDTVGAGDTFCGYLAGGLDWGMALEPALRRASAAAALACLKPGAQPAIPVHEEVREAMERGRPAV